jgi:Winged helix DNA-binding domain
VADDDVTPAVARERFRSQLLTGERAADPLGVVERLLAVQAQDPRGFRLAVRARSHATSATEVERALTVDRTLVVDWLCRGTLHLVRADDHAWLHALTTPQLLTSNRRRLQQEGVSPEQAETGVRTIEAALRDDGPLTRDQLRARLDAAGVPTARQALVHVLGLASFRGVCLRGPVVDGEQAFVHVEDWLGPRPPVDPEVALGELARRYLVGHGPAGERDLAAWAGITLGAARRGLTRIAGSLTGLPGGLVRLTGREQDADDLPAPTLLGAFDPVLHGWPDRRWVLGDVEPGVVTNNGVFRPVALVGGRAVATWGLAAGRLTRDPLPGVRIAARDELALDVDADRVVAYLG